ncbi:Hpt domain-containing protein [Parendozoicomonas sp. Alg238-R29]|uniref:Hpt domain-containing protein n=1 Tax=Parendozoicomonas sp. Alg238-R29 TaxID=2993446 RepID=UPI00248D8307|nr:Hpt domain-containing protein [Parendozoicomonas sp. Alg238-R29]
MGDHRDMGDQNLPESTLAEHGGQSQDWVALDWVRGEITDTLAQARQSLEAYVGNSQDDTRLRFCQNYIHQIHGTLEMVEFYGAALLAEEMEGLIQALLDGTLSARDEALEVLMQAILQLPPYLEQVQAGRRDLPVVILPILNDLRSARGESLLSETSLFSPDLSGLTRTVDSEELARLNSDSLMQLVKKLRQMYQFALVGFFKNPSDKVSQNYLDRVFNRMESLCEGLPSKDIWPIAQGLVQALVAGGIQNNPTIRNLLRQIDQVLQRLVNGGPTAFNQPVPEDLLKNSLYYIALSTCSSPKAQEMKEKYQLGIALLDEETVNREREKLSGPDREAMGSVVKALSEELMTVKDALDLYVRNPEGSALSEQIPALRQIADTLAVLGMGIPRKIILEQIEALSTTINSQNHDDNQLMDIAGSLLYVEATLSGMADKSTGVLQPSEESADFLNARRTVIQEACTGLDQAKGAIVDFTALQWDKSYLEPVPETLASVYGSLEIISQSRVSQLVKSASDYVEKVLLPSDADPEWASMELLADVLAGAEYYLERLGDGDDEQGESILDIACESLEQLGLTETADIDVQEVEIVAPDTEELTIEDFTVDEFSGEIDLNIDFELDDVELEESAEQSAEVELSFDDLEVLELGASGSSEQQEPADTVEVIEEIEIPDLEIVGLEQEETIPVAVVEEEEDELDEELIEIFAEEVGEVRELLQEYFPRWQANQQDQEALTEFRRGFHTLKGSGRMVGATVVGELGWSVENMLNRVIEGTVGSCDAIVNLVDRVIALLPALVDDFANSRQQITDEVQACMDEADAWSRGEVPVQVETEVESAAENAVENTVDSAIEDCEISLDEDELDLSFELDEESPEEFTESEIEVEEIELETIALDESLKAISEEVVSEEVFSEDIALEDILLEETPFDNEVTPEGEQEAESVLDMDSELLVIFSKEALTHLGTVNVFIDQFNKSESSLVISDGLQLALHTLKGSAGMAGLTHVAELVSGLERMAKEFRSMGLEADEQVVGLLTRTSLLLQESLDQINAGVYQDLEISGAIELAADVQELYEERIAACVDEQTESLHTKPSISSFITKYMDLVLDAAPSLREWNRNPEDNLINDFQTGLQSLVDSAREIEQDIFADASEQLIVVYQTLRNKAENVSDAALETLITAHDHLVDMMDQLAAQQSPVQSESILSRLQALVDGLEAEPEFEDISHAIEETVEELSSVDQQANTEQVLPVASVEIVEDDDIDPELVAIFLDEAVDNLGAASAALYRWLDETSDLTDLAELQRHLHTIKGGARMAGITAIGDLGHELEDVYEALSQRRLQASNDLINLLLRGHDALEEMLSAIRSHNPCTPADGLCKEIRAVMKQAADTEQSSEEPAHEVIQTPEVTAETTPEPEADLAQKSVASVELPEDIDLEMIDIFKEEAGDLLDEIEKQVTGWIEEPGNREWPELLMRSLHTLKGSARMAGLQTLGEDSHNFEMKVQQIQELGTSDIDVAAIKELAGLQGQLHSGFDAILNALSASAQQEVVPIADSNVVPFPGSGAPDNDERISAPAAEILQKAADARTETSDKEMVRVSAELLDELVNLAGETSISRSRIEQQISDFNFTLKEMHTTIDRLQGQLRRLDIETQAQILSRHEGDVADHPDFDPLEMDQYSELTQLSRALVESATDLMDLKGALEDKNRDSETLLLQQSRINTELQEGLMRTRMLPFNRMLPRLRRIVRQVSAELGKQVELKVVNAEGEMDRSVMERMVAPLEHMLRNAIDHGIEDSSQLRVANGKPEAGEIRLNLEREGGEIVLSLADDGRGLNLDAVRSKAVEKGLLDANAEVSESDISHMIFQPGFTTASNVTQISGRGVGMDVVNSELKQLGGHIDIHTEEGKGTEFEIRLPFTLSVNRALMVNVGEEQYAIPLNTLEGIVRLSPFELESHYSADDQTLEYAGRSYQLHYLGELLHDRKPKLENVTHELPVLLVRAGDSGIAIHVDSLVASREVVVKSLGPQFAGVRGVSGATILGDGRVVVILDPVGLLLGYTKQQVSEGAAQTAAPVIEEENNLVMVVDDSVTVRKVTGRLLKRNGYRTVSARDGVEAISLLQEHRPAVMLLDIEMPRMDGFEVATAVRNHPELKDLPIIMITSRTGEKHRQRAQDIGVNEYLGKPFQEGVLLETISGFAKRHD